LNSDVSIVLFVFILTIFYIVIGGMIKTQVSLF